MSEAKLAVFSIIGWLAHGKRRALHVVRVLVTCAAWAIADFFDGLAPVAVVRMRALVIVLQGYIVLCKARVRSVPWEYSARRLGPVAAGVAAVLVLTVAPVGAVYQLSQHDYGAASVAAAAPAVVIEVSDVSNVDFADWQSDNGPKISLLGAWTPGATDGESYLAGDPIIEDASSVEGVDGDMDGADVVDGADAMSGSNDMDVSGVADGVGVSGIAGDVGVSVVADDADDAGASGVAGVADSAAEDVQAIAQAEQIETLAHSEQEAPADTGNVPAGNIQEIQVPIAQLPTTESSGAYIWPANGTLSSRFGSRSGSVGSSNHKGIDISGRTGDPIYAADGGVVIVSGWSRSFGYMIQIRHDNGHITLYAHCSKLLVSEGDTVAQGQQIAEMGRTGIASGVHLHFELIINGKNVDPLKYIT